MRGRMDISLTVASWTKYDQRFAWLDMLVHPRMRPTKFSVDENGTATAIPNSAAY